MLGRGCGCSEGKNVDYFAMERFRGVVVLVMLY